MERKKVDLHVRVWIKGAIVRTTHSALLVPATRVAFRSSLTSPLSLF